MVDRLHPVVNVEDLTFSQELPADGGRDRSFVERADVGQDGMAVFRGRPDVAHLPDPRQSHF